MKTFDIVVACDKNLGIGIGNALPWRLPEDMKHFRELTSRSSKLNRRNAVIMGRNTWESIPTKFRPLPNRLNIVLSRYAQYQAGSAEDAERVKVSHTLEEALQYCDQIEEIDKCFIIGGAKLYEQSINHPSCDLLYLTDIDEQFNCDVFFPPFASLFKLESTSREHNENGIRYWFKIFKHQQQSPS